jgi:hypothetical protein
MNDLLINKKVFIIDLSLELLKNLMVNSLISRKSVNVRRVFLWLAIYRIKVDEKDMRERKNK